MSDSVTLSFLADTRNVSLARTVAAAMSARADLPLDQLEDVRLAVDEAVSQLILDARPGAEITCRFSIDGSDLDIRVSAPSASGEPPAHDTFSWTVLTALVDDVAATIESGEVLLDLHIRRQIPVQA
jgi:serine/threonine-protein kinase RsbW